MNSLITHDKIERVRLFDSQVIEVTRKKYNRFLIGTIATSRVTSSSLNRFLEGRFTVQFIANVPSESYWTGEAIEFAEQQSIAFGGMSDLFSAIGVPDVTRYKRKEFSFVERGLRQHNRVDMIERIHDRMYVVRRSGLNDVIVVLANAYELTADHVRTAGDRYGPFTDILITNPNGEATSSAMQAADSMGAQVSKWGVFLSRLNRQ